MGQAPCQRHPAKIRAPSQASENSLRQDNLLLDAHTVLSHGHSQAAEPTCRWAEPYFLFKRQSCQWNSLMTPVQHNGYLFSFFYMSVK